MFLIVLIFKHSLTSRNFTCSSQLNSTFLNLPFLGGLSLHLNHLIAQHMSAPYWQFGTLPINIFCQIWTQDSLRYLS